MLTDSKTRVSARVLYVDDNSHDVALVRRALEEAGEDFELVVAPSRTLLEHTLETRRFDVALTDFDVLGHAGLDIVDRIRERLDDVPVVLLTGTGSEAVAAEALRRGVDDYVIKTPEQIRRLPKRLNLLLEARRLRRENVEAAAELVSTSESYLEILRTSPDAMLVLGPDREIRFANPAAEAMFGHDTGTLLGEVFSHPIGSPGESIDIEISQGGGGIRFGELRAVGITWEGEPATLAVIRDITERSRLLAEQQALARTSSIFLESDTLADVFQEVLDQLKQVVHADAGYVSRRTPEDENEVVILDPGAQICRIDVTSTRIRGLRELAYRSSRPIYENAFSASAAWALVPPGHIAIENVLFCPIQTREGVWGLIGLANKPGGFDESDARITEAFSGVISLAIQRQSHLDALRESETRFKVIFHNAMDGIVLADMETGRVLLANRAMEQLLGYTPDSLLERPLSDVVSAHTGHGEAVDPAGEGDGRILGELSIRRPDGETRDAEVHAARLLLEGRDVVVGVFRDVTERKRLQAAMAQSDRLATMGMLAAGVAHEINNPLSYLLYNLETSVEDLGKILGQARLSDGMETAGARAKARGLSLWAGKDGCPRDLLEDVYSRVREAATAAQRIKDIARGLGTFSRVERPEQFEVDLVEAVEHAVSMAHNEIKYRARLVKRLEPVPPVLASEGRLAQVALNLVVNAAQSMDEGDVEHNEIRIRTWVDDDQVCLEVADTGHGIPEKDLERIFDPFFSTKPAGVGSGLGLTICKTIVSEYGGDISVSSAAGAGTTFVVRLPHIGTSTGARAAPRHQPEPLELAARGRVLVVDDEPAIRRILQRLLERDHQVVLVASGDAARSVLDADQAFDVILCDIMMSEGSGMDLHAWLEDVHPVLSRRVIFMSGGAFTPRARDYMAKVDTPHIDKPFDMPRLRRLVAERVRAARGSGSSSRAG